MPEEEIKKLLGEVLRTDGLLAVGGVLIALSVNLFALGEYILSLVFLVCAGGFLFLRSLRKVDKMIKAAGGVVEEKKDITEIDI